MKTDLLASRHIGINEQDTALMLRKIGVNSLDELIDKTIPANIRLKEPLALTSPLTEYEFGKHIAELANKNKLYTTYIGLGWYNTITPAVIQRNVSKTRYGTLLTLLIRQKCRKDAWKR
jgi:glycine dehydrogenase